MKLSSNLFLTTIIYFLISNLSINAQNINLEQIVTGKPFKVNGTVSANSVFFDSNQESARDSFTYFVQGALNFSVYQFSMPVSYSYSNQGENLDYQIPFKFNRLSLHPKYKWIQAHIGDASMTFSPYTLSAHPFTGGGYNNLTPRVPNINEKFTRYSGDFGTTSDGLPILAGGYTSPGTETTYNFGQRALDKLENKYDYFYEIEILDNSIFTVVESTVIPWFGQGGNGQQALFTISELGSNGHPKSWTQLAKEGKAKVRIIDSPSGNNSLAGTTIYSHPNWVEVTDIQNKISARIPHILRIDMNANGIGFSGCHSKIALDDYVTNQPTANFELRNKIIDTSGNGIYEAEPVIVLQDGTELVKTNNGGKSTFFPDSWNEAKILEEVEYAIRNNHGLNLSPGASPNQYYGFSKDGGIEINFYLTNGGINSYFPVKSN